MVASPRSSVADALRDRYPIERELGCGGMATVFLARDRRHGRVVAVKVLLPEVAMNLGAERFLREIELAAGLTHPHIVPVYDSGEADGLLYYVMPYVEGQSLRERLSQVQRLPVDEAVRLGREVAGALDYAHRRGVVHRDVKPENILLEEGHAMVTDFGIARAVSAAADDRLTQTGSTLGTPMYMSPEQAAGEPDLDGRSDIYSLGCVLFEALTGLAPFSGASLQAVMVRRLTESPPPVRSIEPAIPARVDAAVARALARHRDDRFASAAGLAEALETGEVPGLSSEIPVRPVEASVAVLPFANLSPDRENEYFSDGVSEELINALSKVPGVRVASRPASFGLKGKDLDLRVIGERLRVRTVVGGSVRKAGSRLRITAQLIDAASGYQLWSETYDRDLGDVFEIQEEIARTLAATLRPQLITLGSSAPPLVEPGTQSLEAYTLLLRGMHYSWKRSPETYRVALGYFQQAVEADPAYARAYAGVAHAYTMLGFDEFAALPPHEAMPKAKAAITRALEIDPTLDHALSRRALITFLFDWDWIRAEQEFDEALRMNPRDLITLHWYSLFLSAMGRHEESLALITRAFAVDHLSETMHVRLGHAYYLARQHDAAVKQLQATVEMEPGSVENRVMLARVYLALSRYSDAVALVEEAIRRAGRAPILLTFLACAYGASGRKDDALRVLAELRAATADRYLPPIYTAVILMAAGEVDEGFRWWNLAHQQRSGWMVFLRAEPLWDPYRSDPRFVALLKDMRLDL